MEREGSESPTRSKGPDYVPFGNVDRADNEEVDITKDLDEEESMQ